VSVVLKISHCWAREIHLAVFKQSSVVQCLLHHPVVQRVLLVFNVSFQRIIIHESFNGVLLRGCDLIGEVGEWKEGSGDVKSFLVQQSAVSPNPLLEIAYSKRFTSGLDACVSV
jgi:hypothetical protein